MSLDSWGDAGLPGQRRDSHFQWSKAPLSAPQLCWYISPWVGMLNEKRNRIKPVQKKGRRNGETERDECGS